MKATELETRPSAAKYAVFVDEQLARVRSRIRALDAGRSVMMLGVVTLAYFLVMSAFDLAAGGADDPLVTGKIAGESLVALFQGVCVVLFAVVFGVRFGPDQLARMLLPCLACCLLGGAFGLADGGRGVNSLACAAGYGRGLWPLFWFST